MNRPKQIGTAGETGVVRSARAAGFPQAERRALRGSSDVGDVLLAPGVIVEVKSGKAAKDASLAQVGAWMVEADRERVNAGADLALLVVQRRGFAPARAEWWDCWLPLRDAVWSVESTVKVPLDVGAAAVCMRFGHALLLLRHGGWGDPL